MAKKIILRSTAKHAASKAKKICVHGQSGSGKTALAATCAPFKPLVIITERTGEETLQRENIVKMYGANRADILYDIDFIEAYTAEAFEDALKFANESVHDLIIMDSGSKASRLILKEAKGNYTDGRKAYGEHNDTAMNLTEDLMSSSKHVVIVAHTSRQEDSDTNEILYFPSFEGKGFTEKFVYEMAHVLFLGLEDDDGESEPYRALRTRQQDTNKRCKTRGGRLEDLEEPHLGRLIQKLQGIPAAERIANGTVKKKVVTKK